MDFILGKAYKIMMDEELIQTKEEIKEQPTEQPIKFVGPTEITYVSEEQINSNPILKEFSEKYSKEELTPDGIPSAETQLREIAEKDEERERKVKEDEEKNKHLEMTQRVLILSLHKLGKKIFTNTKDMSTRERKKLQDVMHSYNDIPPNIIINEFNELMTDEIFDNRDFDYTKAPIYDRLYSV
jgi:hypothetical protein